MLNRYVFFATSSLILSLPLTVHSQSSISFRGTTPQLTIQLDPAQPVEFSAQTGNLEASCLLQPGTTQCQGVNIGNPGQVPGVTLTVTGLNQDGQGRYLVAAGAPATVQRAITNSAHVCLATTVSGPGSATGWDNLFAPAASSTASVRFPSSGEFQIGLRCYNAAGAAAAPTTLTFMVEAPIGPNPDACTLPSDPGINQTGFARRVLSWNDIFGSGPFPNYTTPSPVGSYTIGRTLNGPLSAGMYITVPFTAQANRVTELRHYTAQYQVNSPPGHSGPWYIGDASRAGRIFVSVSPCAGDVRQYNPSSPDQFLSKCRANPLVEGPLFFSTGSSASLCRLQAGETYWITWMMADPAGGLTTSENTCTNNERCESIVQVFGEPTN
jgi:hypothetical protein